MKIALLVPRYIWSMNFVAEGFKKYVDRPDYTFDIIRSHTIPKQLVNYDWIIDFFIEGMGYNRSTYQRVRVKYIGVLTGLLCYNRIKDWSIFKYIFAVSK